MPRSTHPAGSDRASFRRPANGGVWLGRLRDIDVPYYGKTKTHVKKRVRRHRKPRTRKVQFLIPQEALEFSEGEKWHGLCEVDAYPPSRSHIWAFLCLLLFLFPMIFFGTHPIPPSALNLHKETAFILVQDHNNLNVDYGAVVSWKNDFAAESKGGCILDNSNGKKDVYFLFFLLPSSNPPQNIIRPEVDLNSCWAAEARSAEVTIKLSSRVKIMGFTLEHLPVLKSPTANIISAPKHFEVFGIDSGVNQKRTSLGIYKYLRHGKPVQRFIVQVVPETPFKIIKLKVYNNWGHPDYTTLCSFKVHEARGP